PMDVELLYGEHGLVVSGLPEARTTVVQPEHLPPAADEAAAVRGAMRRPGARPPPPPLVPAGPAGAISGRDRTRPPPREVVVPAILGELEGLVRLEDVTVLVATGTHRGNTEPELRAMLGDEVVDGVRVVNHDARDDATLAWAGHHGDGVPVWLNREWLAA